MRPLQASIDFQALIYNFKRVKAYSSNSKVMSVLKANADGHGLIEVARALNKSDGFSVLSLTEAIELREHGFNQEILMLEGFFEKYEVSIAAQLNIGVTLHNQEQLDLILNERPKKPIDIHLKVNTGMNRLGFLPEKVPYILKAISAAHSRTWVTDPGVDVSSSEYIVWIESITTTLGLCFSVIETIFSKFISERIEMSDTSNSNRLALIAICCEDSSPLT